MPLPTLNWRRLAPVTLAANNVNDALNAIYTAGTALTYADGSARTPGVDCAWTWSRDTTNAIQPGATTAVWGTPPTSFPGVTNPGTVLPQTVIWAGSTTAPGANTPMWLAAANQDARTANMVYVANCVNPGAYSNWNSATPFTSGDFTGYANAMVLPTTAVWGQMQMYESQECVIVQFWRGAANVQTSISFSGAYIDPGTTSSLICETDGRMYGLATSGANNYNSATFLSATADALLYETNIANNSRMGVKRGGLSAYAFIRRFGTFAPTTGTVSRGLDVAMMPIYAESTSANFLSPMRLREMYIVRDAISGREIQASGVAVAYTLGANWQTTPVDALALTV